jgi:hypothetical protein
MLGGAIWGCASNVTTHAEGTGGEGGATTASTSVHAISTATTTTSTTTGGGGSGGSGVENGSFATAQSINVGVTLMENLEAAGNAQYFVFTGKKGEALDIEAIAQDINPQSPAPYDPSYIDTVISLYDATQAKIAENDEGVTSNSDDADLFTILPADGTYYLRVTDCYGGAAL